MMSSPAPFSNRSTNGHIVIVGASLAGLRAAETLRTEGFTGRLTLIGDEPYEPYDRPPLSKTVLAGWISEEHAVLPRRQDIAAEWLLGARATALDLSRRQVQLADGRKVSFDRLLISTGVRARPWPDREQAALDGVFTVRTRDDAARLHARLAARPKRVLVIGAGFTGSEVASVCRELGLEVTVTERGATPLQGALGQAAGAYAAALQRRHGVDLRCNTTVLALEGDAQKKLRRARLSDGDELDVEVAVVALGSLRNVEWLQGAGLAADGRGVVCDAACRAFDADGVVTDDIFVAGDVARWPHPLYDGELLVVEHWSNAVTQAETAAHNMLATAATRRAHKHLPSFWSNQFGANIKAIGLPSFADTVVLTQVSSQERRLVAAYGREGRLVAVLATMQLLLIAGHETTVNLITNSMLALLRHPEVFDSLRRNPSLAIPAVEEVLRYDPPVQFRTRTTLADIPVAGVTIPRGATVVLLLASGSRDPARFVDADRFWPERKDNEHLGFGGADHYCIGAPLARREVVTALKALTRRLDGPRLVTDPPPYRRNAALRGPEHLQVAFDHLSD